MLTEQFKQYSSTLMEQGLYRQRRVIAAKASFINFSQNDYLSLTSDLRLKKAYQQGFERYPIGSGGSMVVCGYHAMHRTLEKAFTEALSVDDCILFSSGYAANLSVIHLLSYFNTHVLMDKMIHASIYDGFKLSIAQYTRYLHNHLDDLASKIKTVPANTVLLTESIFSMSGQLAPLAAIANLTRNCLQGMIVDEAHAFGVLGPQGLGAVAQQQLTQVDVPLRIIPLGKAFAATGAVVAGQSAWIDALLQLARPYIYSTGMSPALAYGLLTTLDVVRAADERRAKLNELVHYFRHWVKRSPLMWSDSSSPIQQLKLGCPKRALAVAAHLYEQSIHCLPMREPTVNRQNTGLRILLNYQHQFEDIDYLFKCLHHYED